MGLQAVHAIYKDGKLIFADPEMTPKDGTPVLVTYFVQPRMQSVIDMDPIQALRGRGKGERLVEKLLQSRREDRERDAILVHKDPEFEQVKAIVRVLPLPYINGLE